MGVTALLRKEGSEAQGGVGLAKGPSWSESGRERLECRVQSWVLPATRRGLWEVACSQRWMQPARQMDKPERKGEGRARAGGHSQEVTLTLPSPLSAPGWPLTPSVPTLPLAYPPPEFGCRVRAGWEKIFQHRSQS